MVRLRSSGRKREAGGGEILKHGRFLPLSYHHRKTLACLNICVLLSGVIHRQPEAAQRLRHLSKARGLSQETNMGTIKPHNKEEERYAIHNLWLYADVTLAYWTARKEKTIAMCSAFPPRCTPLQFNMVI